ncbi:MAG: flagellar basal body P-ring protein FlgI [Myxococcota bacterium]|nr:flagellar basal body P-ring protein FlgI [Myxococcota bacterium]
MAAVLLALCAASPAGAVRVKDLASVKGVRENQVIGYGLVVGLNGTGDREGTEFTVRSLASLLAKLGIGVDPEEIEVRNVAAVMVTAMLPPFARNGSRIDAVVSSMGDARSLEGGTLLMTPLFGTDGEVYAIGQGPLSVGGFSAAGGGSSVQKNHPTVGRIAGGVTIERELPFRIDGRDEFELALSSPDFTTALRTAAAINEAFGSPVAEAVDSGTIVLWVPPEYATRAVSFMAAVESVEVRPDARARVVVNERTGTVVMGADVKIAKVAVSHGSLSVTISTNREASQPSPFSAAGDTAIVENVDVEAAEEAASLSVIGGPVTIAELVRGLNAMGVTPRDLIAILQAIKASGAMSAELELL